MPKARLGAEPKVRLPRRRRAQHGYLLKAISGEEISPDDIFLLVEQGALDMSEDSDGELVLSISEPGNRTRYYGDLTDEGCPILIWDNSAAMKLIAVNVAMSHVARHGHPALSEAVPAVPPKVDEKTS